MPDEHNTCDDAERLAELHKVWSSVKIIEGKRQRPGQLFISWKDVDLLLREIYARDAALRDAREQINTEWQEKREIARYSAAKDEVVAAARKLLSGERGFHSDYEGLAATRRELREAIARLDAVPSKEGDHG